MHACMHAIGRNIVSSGYFCLLESQVLLYIGWVLSFKNTNTPTKKMNQSVIGRGLVPEDVTAGLRQQHVRKI